MDMLQTKLGAGRSAAPAKAGGFATRPGRDGYLGGSVTLPTIRV